MFKALGLCIKLVIFSILVLILGNWLHWDGKTISDQVKLKMAHAERVGIVDTMRDWAEKVTHDAKKGFQKKTGRSSSTTPSEAQEEITSSERQKLKALIRELNSSHGKNE